MAPSSANSLSLLERPTLYLVLQFISLGVLSLPNGVCWYFGNMVVYVNSFWFSKHGETTFISPWVMSAHSTSDVLGMMAGGKLIKRFDSRIVCLLGILFFGAGIFSGNLSVRCSQPAFILAYGCLTGFGYGIMTSEILTRLSILVSSHYEIAYAVIKTCMSSGAILIQWGITWYINPLDEVADVSISGKFQVFTQKSVIDKVPNVFIVLGLFSAACHSVGFLLTFFLTGTLLSRKKESKSVRDIKEVDVEALESSSLSPDSDARVYSLETNEKNHETSTNQSITPTEKVNAMEEGQGQNQHNESSTPERKTRTQTSQDQDGVDSDSPSSNKLQGDKTGKESTPSDDLTQLQMLRKPAFYIIWFSVFAVDTTYFLILNFYKIFGELWIKDDHFLTHLGMAFLVSVITLRLGWAFVMDKFGAKKTQVLLTASMALTCSFYYYTPGISRWLFSACTCFLGALVSAVYLIYPGMTLKLFGPSHFASNYSVVMTSTVVLNLTAPIAANFLLHRFGWLGVFMSAAGINTLALCVVVVGL